MSKTHESRITFLTHNTYDGLGALQEMVTKHKSEALAEKYIAGFRKNSPNFVRGVVTKL